jgi:hypothetical protein
MKLNENTLIESRVISCGRTDSWTHNGQADRGADMKKLIVASRNIADASDKTNTQKTLNTHKK